MEFASILSKAMYDNQDLREFVRSESLKQFDRDYDVFYPLTQNKTVNGKETFRELLSRYDEKGMLPYIEDNLPLLTILVPDWSWVDGQGERNLLHEMSGMEGFVQSWITATVGAETDGVLNFDMVVPVPSCTLDADGHMRNAVSFVEIIDSESWNNRKFTRKSIEPNHWTTQAKEESSLKDIGQGQFSFSFYTSLYDIEKSKPFSGRILYTFLRKR